MVETLNKPVQIQKEKLTVRRAIENRNRIKEEIREIALQKSGVIYLSPERASDMEWEKMGVL